MEPRKLKLTDAKAYRIAAVRPSPPVYIPTRYRSIGLSPIYPVTSISLITLPCNCVMFVYIAYNLAVASFFLIPLPFMVTKRFSIMGLVNNFFNVRSKLTGGQQYTVYRTTACKAKTEYKGRERKQSRRDRKAQ